MHTRKRSLAGSAISVLVFLLTASPLIVALTHTKNRLTVGDSGKINYLWLVDGVSWIWWMGNFPESSDLRTLVSAIPIAESCRNSEGPKPRRNRFVDEQCKKIKARI